MNRARAIYVLVSCLATAAAAEAQDAPPVRGWRGTAQKRFQTWEHILERDKTTPPARPGAPSPNHAVDPVDPIIPLRADAPREIPPPAVPPLLGAADGPCNSFIGAGPGVMFQAILDNGASIPPDTMGAIGRGHAMTMLNTQVRIQDRTGATNYSTVNLAAFWPGLTGPFDPKIYYDSRAERWIAVCIGNARSASSNWSIAVSNGQDPTGGWSFLLLDSDAGDTRWADYPCVGFNDKWIVVTFNMFVVPGAMNPGPAGPKMWVIDKAQMLGPGQNVDYTEFDVGFVAGGGNTLQPAVCMDANEPDVLIVDSSGFVDPNDQFPLFRLSRVTGPTASPSWQTLPGSNYSTPGFFKAPHRFTMELRTAPQLGSTTPVEVGNSRACNAVFRNGRLYFCHSGGGFFGGFPTNETLSFWYQLLPTLPNPVENWSYIGEGTGTAVFYPSIAVNCHGDIGIGYSRTSATLNISTGFAFIPAGLSGAATYNLSAGGAPYVRLDGSGRNRWGDYSATVVDPRDNMSFWTIQESATATANQWTTRWSQFPHNCSGPPTITSQPMSTGVCQGQTINLFFGATGSGSNTYQWFRNGIPIPYQSDNLQITNAQSTHSGTYYAIVHGLCGATRSADAVVQVGLTISQNPQDQTIAPCQTVQFRVAAQGVGTLQYLWYKVGVAGVNFPLSDDGHFSGTQTATLTIDGARYDDERQYLCRIIDPACSVQHFTPSARLSIAPPPPWAHRTSSGPVRRVPWYTDMAYDESRGVCVLYGGSIATQAGFTWGNDTWEWDGIEWTRRFPTTNPGLRAGHEMVYDSVRNKILLFGGYTPSVPFGDATVWQYDGTDWVLLTTSPGGPTFNNGNQGDAVFDHARGKMILMTSQPGGTFPANQTWEFDPATLTWQMTYAGTSIEFGQSPLLYDSVANSIVAAAKIPFASAMVPWRYTGAGWLQLASAGPARYNPVVAFDSFRARATLFGNARNELSQGNFYNDTYALINNTWTQVLPEIHPLTADRLWPAAMVFDTRRNAMVVVGNSVNTYTGLNPMDTWEYRYLDRIVIDRQPQDQPLTIGSTTQFKVFAAGAGSLTYQWHKSGAPLANGPTPAGSAISGALTNTLTITNTAAADAGAYTCQISNACGTLTSAAANLGQTCYPNCDGSTTPPILNVLDFSCFLNRFAAGDPYANCDQSTTPPILNVLDFSCFLNTFAAGCP